MGSHLVAIPKKSSDGSGQNLCVSASHGTVTLFQSLKGSQVFHAFCWTIQDDSWSASPIVSTTRGLETPSTTNFLSDYLHSIECQSRSGASRTFLFALYQGLSHPNRHGYHPLDTRNSFNPQADQAFSIPLSCSCLFGASSNIG